MVQGLPPPAPPIDGFPYQALDRLKKVDAEFSEMHGPEMIAALEWLAEKYSAKWPSNWPVPAVRADLDRGQT